MNKPNRQNTYPKGQSIYASLSTEALYNMLQAYDVNGEAEKQKGTPADERTSRNIEEIRVELAVRKERASTLIKEYSRLADLILNDTSELDYLKEKNNNNWNARTDSMISEIEKRLQKNISEQETMVDFLEAIGFNKNGEIQKTINIIHSVRKKVHQQLELPI